MRSVVRGILAVGILLFAWWAFSRIQEAITLPAIIQATIAALLLLLLFRGVAIAERRRRAWRP
jgi:hypothetical protein